MASSAAKSKKKSGKSTTTTTKKKSSKKGVAVAKASSSKRVERNLRNTKVTVPDGGGSDSDSDDDDDNIVDESKTKHGKRKGQQHRRAKEDESNESESNDEEDSGSEIERDASDEEEEDDSEDEMNDEGGDPVREEYLQEIARGKTMSKSSKPSGYDSSKQTSKLTSPTKKRTTSPTKRNENSSKNKPSATFHSSPGTLNTTSPTTGTHRKRNASDSPAGSVIRTPRTAAMKANLLLGRTQTPPATRMGRSPSTQRQVNEKENSLPPSVLAMTSENPDWQKMYEEAYEGMNTWKRKFKELQQIIYSESDKKTNTKRTRKTGVDGRKLGSNESKLANMDRPEDAQNFDSISKLITNEHFIKYKLLPKGWHQYRPNDDTTCRKFLRVCVIPDIIMTETTKGTKWYWNEVIVPMIQKKYTSIKANYTQKMKRMFYGEVLFYSIFSYMSFHITSCDKECLTFLTFSILLCLERTDCIPNNTAPTVDEHCVVKFKDMENATNLEHYIRFIEGFVVPLLGLRKVTKFFKTHTNKSIFDMMDESDEAWAISVLRNNEEMWIHEYNKKKEEAQETRKLAQKAQSEDGE